MKKCKVCFEEKPLELFGVDSNLKDGHRNYCKQCRSAADKKGTNIRIPKSNTGQWEAIIQRYMSGE